MPSARVGIVAHPAPPRLLFLLTQNQMIQYLIRIHRVIRSSRLPAIVRVRVRARVRAQMRDLSHALSLAHAHALDRVPVFPRALLDSPGPTRFKR